MATILSKSSKFVDEEAFQISPSQSLHDALQLMNGDPPSSIPFPIWLLENPASPIALPGKIDLHRHDCLHLLLNRGFSLYDEAFVVGFTMGNDPQTNWVHLVIFKLISWLFYPPVYRFNWSHFKAFNLGFAYGRRVKVKNLNQLDVDAVKHQSIDVLRTQVGIEMEVLRTLRQAESILVADAIAVV